MERFTCQGNEATGRDPRPWMLPAALVLACLASVFAWPAPAAEASQAVRPPVVVLVLDELSTSMIMTSEGRVDGRRFPNLSALARTGTWYRNHTTTADATKSAVPAILTGSRTRADWKTRRDIFRMLRPTHRLRGFESVTTFCPRSWCPWPPVRNRLAGARLDTRALGNFSLGRFAGALDQIGDGQRPLAWVAHAMVPHVPWRFLPNGTSYEDAYAPFPSLWVTDGLDYWTDNEYGIALSQQRALLQVGFADRIVGEMRLRLEQAGLWHRAMVVVVADHGATFAANEPRRSLTPSTFGEMAMVPLFVKYPRQVRGRVSDRPTNSAQIVPTIARWVDGPAEYRGTTLDEAPPGRDVVTRSARSNANLSMPLAEVLEQRQAAILRRDRRLPRSSLYRTSAGEGLVGRRPSSVGISAPADGSIQPLGQDGAELRPSRPGVLNASYLTANTAGLEKGERVAIATGDRIVAVSRVFGYAYPPDNPDGPRATLRVAAMIDPRHLGSSPAELSFYVVRERRLSPLAVR